MAKLIMTVEQMQDRQAWLKLRNSGLGGSDASVILGINPWKSALALWAEKTGELEPEPDVDMMFPAEPEAEEEEQAEYTLSEVKTLEQIALNDYKQHLRELAWRIFASGIPGVHTMEKIYADIGYALVQELGIKNKGGETDEVL